MKKIAVALMGLVLFLSGCAGTKPVSSKTEQYIVSALGFDGVGKGFKISAEAVIVGREGNLETEAKGITGEGETIKKAFSELRKKNSQPLLLSHCGFILFGNSLTFEKIEEVLEYAKTEREITLSVFIGATEKAESLLNLKAVSSVAIGYDIVGMIEQQEAEAGKNFKNRLYEIEALRTRGQDIKLPFFEIQNEEFYFSELRELGGQAK